MIITNATEGRAAARHDRDYKFPAEVSRMIHTWMKFQGVYDADNPDNVRFWAEMLIVNNLTFPGELPVQAVLTRFIHAAMNTPTTGKPASTVEATVQLFRNWINDGSRRQDLFAELSGNGSGKARPRDTTTVEQMATKDLVNLMETWTDIHGSGWTKNPAMYGSGKYMSRVKDELDRRKWKIESSHQATAERS